MQIEALGSPYGKCLEDADSIAQCLHDCNLERAESLCNCTDIMEKGDLLVNNTPCNTLGELCILKMSRM